jgi:hypothetical protein
MAPNDTDGKAPFDTVMATINWRRRNIVQVCGRLHVAEELALVAWGQDRALHRPLSTLHLCMTSGVTILHTQQIGNFHNGIFALRDARP